MSVVEKRLSKGAENERATEGRERKGNGGARTKGQRRGENERANTGAQVTRRGNGQ